MKLGINGTGLVQRASVAAVEADAKQAEQDGFHSYWLAEHPTGGFDALTVLSLVGQSCLKGAEVSFPNSSGMHIFIIFGLHGVSPYWLTETNISEFFS